MNLTETQAHYVLEKMLEDRTVTRRDVDRYLKNMQSDIDDLERRLDRLRSAAGGRSSGSGSVATKGRGRGRKKGRSQATATAGTTRKKSGKKRNLSPEVKASRALQGRYISNLRRFSGKKKAAFQKVAKEQGREEALRQMQAEG